MYGFQSYVSMPIILADGSFFGTLCAIDPRPARLKTPETIGMFRLFAELIAKHLDAKRKLAKTESELNEERAGSELREQVIAVLGHDLRTPMRAISCFVELLVQRIPEDEEAISMGRLIRDSASRMGSLIENLMDFARGRMGGGLLLTRDAKQPLEPLLRQVITELSANDSDRILDVDFALTEPINCDRARIHSYSPISLAMRSATVYGIGRLRFAPPAMGKILNFRSPMPEIRFLKPRWNASFNLFIAAQ